MQLTPIGIMHTPFKELTDMPIQPSGAKGVKGRIELRPEFSAGLQDLAGFSHIYVLYHFHQTTEARMTVTPFLDKQPRGLFATRAPTRPNPIGLSVLALESIDGNTLEVTNVDMLDGTPLLDIKPYVPEFDQPEEVRTGWLQNARGNSKQVRSDQRFL